MRYKSKVLARFPSARVVTKRYHDDLVTPRYRVVIWGATWEHNELDIHDDTSTWQQGATAAWRSAYYYWCVRNPMKEAA